MLRNLVAASQFMLLLQVFSYERFELQMDMPMSMMFDMWVWFFLLAAVLILAVVVAVYMLTRPGQRVPSAAPPPSPPAVENPRVITLTEAEKTVTKTDELGKVVELVRPTLNEDERRILNEVVKAGGEILQSDLPEKSDFSKATVSKVIKSLETMGVVTREKHKWTYWVRISEKLISRTKNA